MSTYDDASLVFYPSGYKASKAYSLKPTDGSGDLTFTRASTATRVNESGLIEEVAANVPRLDNSQGGCSTLLLEPQRTNLLTYSEDFNDASWTKNELTVSANAATSPNGTTNADKLIPSVANDQHFIRKFPGLSANTYTQTIFAKSAGYKYFVLYRIGALVTTFFNLDTGVVDSVGGGVTATMEDFGNGWYKCKAVYTVAGGTVVDYLVSDTLGVTTYEGDGTSGIYVWGADLQVGSYATSYIPTLGTAVTRVADSLSNFTSAAIFGTASDSVVYFEILHAGIVNTSAAAIFRFGDAGAGLQFSLYFDNKGVNVFNYAAPSGFLINETNANGSTIKIAIRWNGAVLTGFHNGVKKTTITRSSGTYSIDRISDMNMSNLNSIGLKSMIIFPTALTDEELIALTTL